MKPEIRTTSGSERELAAAAQLERLLDVYDTRRWLFTDLVRIQSMVVARSHPVLRLNTRHLTDDALALQTYLHEQLHWWLIDLPGVDAAVQEVSARWPEPPGAPDGGAANPFSTWLHLVLCPLEVQAAEEVLGQFTMKDTYSWIYQEILANRPWFDDLMVRHELSPPLPHPVPIRWPVSLDRGVRFYSDDPVRDADLLTQLEVAHQRLPSLVIGEIEVVVDSSSESALHPGLRIGGEHGDDSDAVAVTYAFAQAVVSLAPRPAVDRVPQHLLDLVAHDPYGASTVLAAGLTLPALDAAALSALDRIPLGKRLSPLLPHLAELGQLTSS